MVKENIMKQTEIGLLPEDWEVVYWTDVFDFKSTSSYSRAEINETGIFGYFHYGDIHTKIGSLLNPNVYVSGFIEKSQLKNYTLIKKGDLIIADASEDYSGVGKGFEVSDEPNIPTISGLHTFLVREKKEGTFAYGYKGYFHFNKIIKKQYDNLATGLKVYSLSKGSFKNIQIPLPPLPEQEAIAEALSDADAWIESLEQLIAKKRLIKQGAVQELLTPKEDWEVKKLGEIVVINSGYSPSMFNFFKDGISYLKVDELNNSAKYTVKGSYFIETDSTIKKGSIIFPKRGASIFLNKIRILGEDSFMDTNLMTLTVSENYDNEFLYYSLIYFGLDKIADTTSIPQINNKHILPLQIPFPSLTEQTRIATILSDMDAELEALEAQLGKARKVKQGMMQELLTGRVRLV